MKLESQFVSRCWISFQCPFRVRGWIVLRFAHLVSWGMLAVGLAGCTTPKAPADETERVSEGEASSDVPKLYLHFGTVQSDPQRLLSTRLTVGVWFYVAGGGDEYWSLEGRVTRNEGTLRAERLAGNCGPFAGFYDGAVQTEEPFFAQSGAGSGGAGPVWFGISTNSDPGPIIDMVRLHFKGLLQQNQ